MQLMLESLSGRCGWLSLFQLFSAVSKTIDWLRLGATIKNQGSRKGTREQASLKLTEAAADFHLLHTEVRRKNEEVGSHESTLSKRSSLRSSREKLLKSKLSPLSGDFLFKLCSIDQKLGANNCRNKQRGLDVNKKSILPLSKPIPS